MNVNSCKNKTNIVYANNTEYAFKDKECTIKFSKDELIKIYNKGCLIYRNFENEKKEVYEIPFTCMVQNNYNYLTGDTFECFSSEYVSESTS